jgi:hypothetical protein
MNDLNKRFALFLGLCIPSRFLLSYIAKILPLKYLPFMGIIMLIPVIGWTYIYLTGSRKIGMETLGAEIWWNDLRPLHAGLYFTFVLMAFNKSNNAYLPLFIDTFIGLISFFKYHKIL